LRQQQFELNLDQLIATARAHALDAASLRELRGWLRLDLALFPARGQAGVVLTAYQLTALVGMGAQVAIKSWADHSRTDRPSLPDQ